MKSLREGGVVEVVEDGSLDERAGDIRCERSISLADCYVIALAELVQGAGRPCSPSGRENSRRR
ncbi:MAG: hypothetical protein QI223_10425 [Candidatus Korarchaeota archaeon]|nr:hypothetical protein [Candidatus Korarchaeota archaeon]